MAPIEARDGESDGDAGPTAADWFRVAGEAGRVGAFDWDVVTGRARCSDEYFKVLGASPRPGGWVGYDEWLSWVLPEHRPGLETSVRHQLEAGDEAFGEYCVQLPEGGRRWVRYAARVEHDFAGRPVRMQGTTIDVTDRKLAEARSRESEAFLALALEATGAATFELHADASKAPVLSPVALALLGFGPDARPMMQDCAERIHPADRPVVRAALARTFRDRTASSVEFRVVRSDGSTTWLAGHVRPVADASAPPRAIGVVREITRQKEALRESEARFRKIFRHAATGIAISDLQGRLMQCNPAYEELLGYRGQELRDSDFASLIHPADRQSSSAEFRRLRSGATDSFVIENRCVRKDGTEVWVQQYVSVLPDDAGRPAQLLALVTDIGDRRRLEEERHANEIFTDRLIDSLFVFVGLLDLDGTLRRANRAPLVASGFTEADVLGQRLWDCPWWDRSAGMQRRLGDAVRRASRGRLVRCDVPARIGADSRRWMDLQIAPLRDDQGTTTHLVVSAIDITDRRRAELALAESEARFRAMADDLPLIVWLHDAEGRQQFVNRTFCDYFSVSPAELQDDRWHVLMHPDSGGAYAADFAACLAERRPFHAEVRVRRGDGQWRWLESWGQPRYDADGRFLGILGISADITDRKWLEATAQESARADRSAREQAELLATVMSELEAIDSESGRARRLVELLVPTLADVATVETPGVGGPVVAASTPGGATDPSTGRTDQPSPSARITLPLHLGHRERGVLRLDRHDSRRPLFRQEELQIAQLIADRAGVLLGNARLFEQEHSSSLMLQQSLLPDRIVQHPTVSVAAAYAAGTAALEVGGDWYDSLSLPDGQLALTVGDVVGHGLVAAAAMGRLRTAINTLAPTADGPAALLSDLDYFALVNRVTDFATACYATLDATTGQLRYASAGHPPILLVPPTGAPRWLDDATSGPLTVWSAGTRTEAELTLEPGTLLVLYSDGLIERRRERLGTGMNRLTRHAVRRRALPIGQLCEGLLADLSRADPPGEDDAVVMCVRLEPLAVRHFHRRISAGAQNLAPLRGAMRAWLSRRRIPPAVEHRALIAVGEAAANCIEHAYRGRGVGDILVDLVADESSLTMTVQDHGHWRVSPGGPDRGRGTPLLRAVSDSYHRATGPSGTTVSCRLDFEALDEPEAQPV